MDGKGDVCVVGGWGEEGRMERVQSAMEYAGARRSYDNSGGLSF